jgi:predicted tellurium resistance membrane protein TerC
VIAVAGVAREHPAVLAFGLVFSVTLMGLAANYVARLIQRYHWIAWIGLAIILYVALNMIWHGALEVEPLVVARL